MASQIKEPSSAYFKLIEIASKFLTSDKSLSRWESKILIQIFIESNIFQRRIKRKHNFDRFTKFIEPQIKIEHYEVGDIIAEEGSKMERVCVLIKGDSCIYRPKPAGTIQEIEEVREFYAEETPLVNKKHQNIKLVDQESPKVIEEDNHEKIEHTCGKRRKSIKLGGVPTAFKFASKIVNRRNAIKSMHEIDNLQRKNNDPEENDELLQRVYEKNPKKSHLIKKFGYFRVTRSNKITAGEYFGEKCLFASLLSNITYVASSDCTIISISKEDYNSSLEKIKNANRFRRNFFGQIFQIEDANTIEKFEDFESIEFTKNELIFYENDPVNSFFILYEGEVNLFKGLIIPSGRANSKTNRESIVSVLMAPQFFGDELVFDLPQRKMTARAGPNGAHCYVIKSTHFKKVKLYVSDKLKKFQTFAYAKSFWRENLAAKNKLAWERVKQPEQFEKDDEEKKFPEFSQKLFLRDPLEEKPTMKELEKTIFTTRGARPLIPIIKKNSSLSPDEPKTISKEANNKIKTLVYSPRDISQIMSPASKFKIKENEVLRSLNPSPTSILNPFPMFRENKKLSFPASARVSPTSSFLSPTPFTKVNSPTPSIKFHSPAPSNHSNSFIPHIPASIKEKVLIKSPRLQILSKSPSEKMLNDVVLKESMRNKLNSMINRSGQVSPIKIEQILETKKNPTIKKSASTHVLIDEGPYNLLIRDISPIS